MYNADTPLRAELPSSRQLIRSTIIAAVSVAILLVTVVLPAEYGVDPTGVGRVLGLAEMGEIKTRLAQEAADDAAATRSAEAAVPAEVAAAIREAEATAVQAETAVLEPSPVSRVAIPVRKSTIQAAAPAIQPVPAAWRDEMSFTLEPGQGNEIKLRMKEGDTAVFAWVVQGGVVNFDTHGDGGGRSISYEKGRAVPSAEGKLVAAFTGNHGWFWRNRGKADVTMVLRTGGTYEKIERLK